jgi:hypothetical protein
MFRHTFSPIRVFCGFAAIGVAVLIYMTLNPQMTVEPVATTDPGAAFGTLFDLRNKSVAILYEVSSAYCVNSFSAANFSGSAANSPLRFGVESPGVSLADLARGDTAVLPIENTLKGPPGSQVDLVFAVKFEPGWWIDLVVKRYRFAGTEGPDGLWRWKKMPLGSACG